MTLFLIEAVTTAFIGLVLGSFSTALIYRVPQKKNWISKRSACPSCKHNLSARDLVPFFSWLLAGGKCRYCNVRISARYPAIELICAVVCLVIYWRFGFNIEALFVMASVPFLLSLFFIDIQKMILPNQLVFTLLVIGVVRLFYLSTQDGVFTQVSDMLVPYFGGAFVYAFMSWFMAVIMTKILKKQALGFGDVKFFGVAGLWLGLLALPYFLISSGVLAIAFAIIWRTIYKSERFPFGPALIFSFFGILIFQGAIIQ